MMLWLLIPVWSLSNIYYALQWLLVETRILQTFGELFYTCYDEIQDITLMQALTLLLELFKSTLKNVLVLSEEKSKSYSSIL